MHTTREVTTTLLALVKPQHKCCVQHQVVYLKNDAGWESGDDLKVSNKAEERAGVQLHEGRLRELDVMSLEKKDWEGGYAGHSSFQIPDSLV